MKDLKKLTSLARQINNNRFIPPQTNYRQYLEFSLKLGYSERLVQQALKRLVNPTNNELLAELIKLGATAGSNG